jgi:flagellar biosynthesis/type III secretory pathway chaperone
MNQNAKQAEPKESKVPQVIELLDELHQVVGAENQLLEAGLPASLAKTVERKTQLAAELDGWLEIMRRGELTDGTDPENIARLVARLQSLRVLMGENSLHIKRSMEATRRRIDGIMRALRNEPRQIGQYGAPIMPRRPAAGLDRPS